MGLPLEVCHALRPCAQGLGRAGVWGLTGDRLVFLLFWEQCMDTLSPSWAQSRASSGRPRQLEG